MIGLARQSESTILCVMMRSWILVLEFGGARDWVL